MKNQSTIFVLNWLLFFTNTTRKIDFRNQFIGL